MTRFHRQIKDVLSVVTVLSESQFSWFDLISSSLAGKTLGSLDVAALRAYLLSGLQRRLYTSFYCTGSPTRLATNKMYASHCPDFVRALSDANLGKGCWTAGWTLKSIDGEGVLAERNGICLRAPAGYWRQTSNQAIDIGPSTDVLMPKEQRGISPGFYLAQSEVEFIAERTSKIVRIYWNTTPAGALRLMANLTHAMNAIGLAFRLKAIDHPQRFTRCDSVVLYLHEADFDCALPLLSRAYATVGHDTKPAVPPFTKRLAPGVALAEDPDEAISFGWHRCGLVAKALVDAHESRSGGLERRMQIVSEHFAEAGLRLDMPYLNPGKRDRYPTRIDDVRASGEAPLTVKIGDVSSQRELEAAKSIGEQLTLAALWHEKRCTWLGPAHGVKPCDEPVNCNELRALGPSLYAGTSGVALFLAELAVATGCTKFETAALGGARQGLFLVANHSGSRGLDFHSGWPGIAVAIAHIGLILNDTQLVARARKLIATKVGSVNEPLQSDLVSELAGGVLALVWLARKLGEDNYLDYAERLGTALCDKSSHMSDGCYRQKRKGRQHRSLANYAYGTAGVTSALLELYAETAKHRYLEAAQQVLAHERHRFSQFQRVHKKRHNSALGQSVRCHGASGIAVSRLRAWVLLKDTASKAELDCALESTARTIDTAVTRGTEEVCLCHGLTGNVDVLHLACTTLKDQSSRFTATVERATAYILDHVCRRSEPFAPGLMLGSTGVGLFLLRSARPTTFSPLSIS